MNVLFVSVEMTPLVKVGGLADIAGSLPRALRAAGHDIRVIMPLHEEIDTVRFGFRRLLDGITVGTPRGPEQVAVWAGEVGGVPVYLIEQSDMFERPQVYGEPDDSQRWLFFCDAVLAAAPRLNWQVDVLHLNDWHTAFVAARLAALPDHPLAPAARLYTIHNLGYRGDFDGDFARINDLDVPPTTDPDIDPAMLSTAMALAVVGCDGVNTVSPTYAGEILTPEYGMGLDSMLRTLPFAVTGILNGIDDEEFDPSTDPRLPGHFSPAEVSGREEVRAALLARAAMQPTSAPIVGVVNRLFWQKGADIATAAVRSLLDAGLDFRFIMLGTGDQQYQEPLEKLAARYPDNVALFLRFDPELAQVVYGGCDIFLMPSRYEPCGLGQMIAMRYGAVPVVRRTGGLADTVCDADAALGGRGFCFDEPEGAALAAALRQALAAFRRPDEWHRLQQNGMRADFSWRATAQHYVELYATTMDRARRRALPPTARSGQVTS